MKTVISNKEHLVLRDFLELSLFWSVQGGLLPQQVNWAACVKGQGQGGELGSQVGFFSEAPGNLQVVTEHSDKLG